MTVSIGVSSAWKSCPSIQIGVGGVHKRTFGWIGVGGVWKRCWGATPLIVTCGNANNGLDFESGYDANGIAGFVIGGPVTPNTFVDGAGFTRTVAAACDLDGTTTFFALGTTGIANTDSTFYGIDINGGTILTRASAVYVSSAGGNTLWRWDGIGGFFPGIGDVTLNVY